MNLLWTALLMGLMGGFHCIGMCGPIALALPAQNGSRWQYIRGRIFYNLGRATTYTIWGLVFGIFGLTLNLIGLQQGVSIVSGLLILLLHFAPGNLSGKVARILKLSVFVSSLKKVFAGFLHTKGMAPLFAIGLLNGLLPCGFVYLALAASLASGSVAEAGLYMALFGLGTFPMMLTLSLSGKIISINFKNHFQKAVPYIAVTMALLFILRGLSLDIPYLSPKMAKGETVPTEMSICQ